MEKDREQSKSLPRLINNKSSSLDEKRRPNSAKKAEKEGE
jgi:hypothetical protein